MTSFPYDVTARISDSERPASAQRDLGIDALRGLAVVLMIGANVAPFQLELPYPFWFRAWSSLAAPLFVVLSGLMTGRAAASGRQRPFSYQLKRAMALLTVAFVVDVACWGMTPFYHFDVLYLLACLQLASGTFLRLRNWARALCVALLLLAAEPLHRTVGYRSECSHVGFDMLQAWLIDGWFPVFPWLGLGLAGTFLGALGVDFRQPATRFRLLACALGLLLVGGIYWYVTAPVLQTRWGYAELFYPPTLGYILCALGFVGAALAVMSYLAKLPGAVVLVGFGRMALLIYVAHIALISRVIHPYFSLGSFGQFSMVYLGLTTLMWAMGQAARLLWPTPKGFFPKLLLG